MAATKPTSISNNSVMSAKWDEITKDRNFNESDAPTIALLCQWHAVVAKCMDDLDYNGELQIAYQNQIGDIKAMPQLSTMKQASAEIRALNKQLGIDDEAEKETKPTNVRTPLHVIQANRKTRAESQGRAV